MQKKALLTHMYNYFFKTTSFCFQSASGSLLLYDTLETKKSTSLHNVIEDLNKHSSSCWPAHSNKGVFYVFCLQEICLLYFIFFPGKLAYNIY